MSIVKEILDRRARDMTCKSDSPVWMVGGSTIDLANLVCTHRTCFDIDDADSYRKPEKQGPSLWAQISSLAAKYGYAYYRIVFEERLFADAGGLMVFDRYYVNFYNEKTEP